MTRETSLEAYHRIKDEGLLSVRRWQVYDVLFHNGPLTANQMIKLFQSRYPQYRLTNTGSLATRLSELRDRGVVHEVAEIKCPVSSFRTIQWDVTDKLPVEFKKPHRNKCHVCDGKGYY